MPGGKKPGPSIKNPATYEALKKKGLSKESAAAISNWAVGQGYKKGVHHKSHDEDDDYEAVDGWLKRGGNAMRDREFSASRREELAKKGHAMAGGGFPVESRQDLLNAIHAIGRAKNPAAAKKHIKKRARAMGLTELLPENWDAATVDAKKCPKCDGAGNVDGFKCDRCDGEGYVGIPETQERDELPPQFSCPECHGTGKDPDDDSGSTECDMCNGEGSIPSPERGLSRMLRRNKPASPYPDGSLHVDRKSKRAPPDDDDDEDEEEADIYRDAKRSNDSIALIVDGGKIRRTQDGYLIADARIARTGIQLYNGEELGRPDLGMVRVYRAPNEVFSRRAMHSLAGKPVTLNHPPKMVDSANWDKYAIGHIGEDVTRDGETVRVPMMIMDGKAIRAYERDGVKELSVGYSTELKWGHGTTPEGEIYDAKQTAIRANHLAVVPAARGGSRLRIGDDQRKGGHIVQVLIGDRLISFEDEAEAQHVQAHIKAITDANGNGNGKKKKKQQAGPGSMEENDGAAEEEQEEEKKTRAERDAALGQIAVLKKQLDDANTKLSGGELDKIVKARTELMIKADAIMEGRADFSGKEPPEIQRMVVAAKLGDAVAKALTTDDAVAGAFTALAANVKPRTGVNRLADNLSLLNLSGGTGTNDPKAIRDAAYDGYVKRQSEAWRTVGRITQ